MIQEAADADYQVWLKVGQKISRATREPLLKEFDEMTYDRLEEIKRKGYQAGLNGERCKQYTETMGNRQEVTVFTEGWVFGNRERNHRIEEERRRKEVQKNG